MFRCLATREHAIVNRDFVDPPGKEVDPRLKAAEPERGRRVQALPSSCSGEEYQIAVYV